MSDPKKLELDPSQRLADAVRNVLAPMIAIDGGEISWVGVEEGVAWIALRGACAGCPGQPYTTSAVVLPALQAIDPTITAVKVRVAID